MSDKGHNEQEKKVVGDDGGGGRSTDAYDLQAPAAGQPVCGNAFGGGSSHESNIPFPVPASDLMDMNDGRWRRQMIGQPQILRGGWGGWRGGGGGGGYGVDIGSGNYGVEGNDIIIRNVLGSISNISENTNIGSHNVSHADNVISIDLSADHRNMHCAYRDVEGTGETQYEAGNNSVHRSTREP